LKSKSDYWHVNLRKTEFGGFSGDGVKFLLLLVVRVEICFFIIDLASC